MIFLSSAILALISDFYEDPEDVRQAINHLRLRGNDLIVFHVLDPTELDFDFDEPRQFEDLESGNRIPVIPDRVRAGYKTMMDNHIARIAQLTDSSSSVATVSTGPDLRCGGQRAG